jgi:hypothetical protein
LKNLKCKGGEPSLMTVKEDRKKKEAAAKLEVDKSFKDGAQILKSKK